MAEHAQPFSYDIYAGMDQRLEAYLPGESPDTHSMSSGLSGIVSDKINRSSEHLSHPEVAEWLTHESERMHAAWSKYGNQFGSIPPSGRNLDAFGIDAFLETIPAATCERLYTARETLGTLRTEWDTEVGDGLHVCQIPWRAFYDNLDDLEDWLRATRRIEGLDRYDAISPDVLRGITSDTGFYRDPRQDKDSRSSAVISAKEYLELKLATDGEWGLMLTQTGGHIGTDGLLPFSSANQFTGYGKERLQLQGVVVDSMGVFEWLALTLQESDQDSFTTIRTALLANRFNDTVVPYGTGDRQRLKVVFKHADTTSLDWLPRLTVL